MRPLSRRTLLARLSALTAGVAASGLSHLVNAQPGAPRRIGVIAPSIEFNSAEGKAFMAALHKAGYVEGQDIFFDWWYGGGKFDEVRTAVSGFVRRKTSVLVVESTIAALEAKRATTSIPIVMVLVGDPVRSGLVESLARPGGNITGAGGMTADLAPKRLQLFKETIPSMKRVTVLWNPTTPWHGSSLDQLKKTASGLGLTLAFIAASDSGQLISALSKLSRSQTDGVLALGDAFTASHGKTLVKMTSRARLPLAYGLTDLALKGAIISYAPDHAELFRRAAGYVDKILKGVPPAQLPVEETASFKLIINLKTAKALGITIPESILLRADEVIR